MSSRHPEVKWAQREDRVFITIQLPDSKDANVNLTPDGVLTFSATSGAGNNVYELNLELYDKVKVEESKINKGVRNIFCVVEKAEKVWWKKLLCGDGKAPHYVKVDWDKWVDEDDDTGLASGMGDLDLGGMDFSKFGGMDSMEGMGDDFDDSDDEDEETENAEVAGSSAKEEDKTAEIPAALNKEAAPSK